jgi:hypothetical protein
MLEKLMPALSMKEFVIFLLILCCGCSEKDDIYSVGKEIVNGQPDYYVCDDIVGHTHKSNAKREFSWAEHKDGKIIMKTNNMGFRKDTDTFPVKQGKIRILVTGDSHVDGVVNNNESCCALLEDLLNKLSNDKHYEVINSGVGLYCPRNYLGIIEKYLYIEPDIFIVIIHNGNDFLENCRVLGGKPVNDPEYRNRLREACSFDPGAVGQGLNQIYYFKYFPEYLKVAFTSVTDNIASIKKICDSNNIILMVLLLPTKMELEWNTDELRLNKCKENLKITSDDLQINTKLSDMMFSWLTINKINCLNLYHSLKERPVKLFWNQDYHLNDHGHKIIAEALLSSYQDIFLKMGTPGMDKYITNR